MRRLNLLAERTASAAAFWGELGRQFWGFLAPQVQICMPIFMKFGPETVDHLLSYYKKHSIINSREHHSVNSSSHSVNGDIAIQWEWSNFDHS